MIPGGDMNKGDDRAHVDRVLPTRNRLYSKVKGKLMGYKKPEKVQVNNLTQKSLSTSKTIKEKSLSIDRYVKKVAVK